MASGRADAGGNVTLGIVMRSRQKCKYAVFSAGGLRCVTLQDWTSDLESNSRARAGWKHHQLAVATIPKFVSQVGSACHRRSEARLLSLDGHFCHLLSQERASPPCVGSRYARHPPTVDRGDGGGDDDGVGVVQALAERSIMSCEAERGEAGEREDGWEELEARRNEADVMRLMRALIREGGDS
jgi:hypothetical protein